MKKVTRLLLVPILTLILVGQAVRPADAQSRWRNPRRGEFRRPAAATATQPSSLPARQRAVDPAFNHYPKYIGGFHARYFDEIPSIYGTRVMRGSAW